MTEYVVIDTKGRHDYYESWWIVPIGLALFGAATVFAWWCTKDLS